MHEALAHHSPADVFRDVLPVGYVHFHIVGRTRLVVVLERREVPATQVRGALCVVRHQVSLVGRQHPLDKRGALRRVEQLYGD
eukprot:CAMPEP_0180392570 /NCGR_PEP_ID=MMETSP0989-20121125/33236_1 /TAXON_ID=697907 /ORGANISM="non described non described, Strain CCMP2293" /LENGTH=82 /DNA_ID=CAMNT_0022394295 /DNA_START=404 /DNA_END=652 /DNA_ORIENTATION=+